MIEMSKNTKKIHYCLMGHDNLPHIIFSVIWNKGNLYLKNESAIENFKTKISYHTPRQPSGKSQVNFKVNDVRPNGASELCVPIEQIVGARPMGGSGVQLIDLPKFPVPREESESIIYDARPHLKTELSSIQWYWFLLEPNKENLFFDQPRIKNCKYEFSELLDFHFLKSFKPWIVTEFTRIKEEHPIWYKDLPNPNTV